MTLGGSVADKVDAKVDKILGAKKIRIPGITDPIQPKQRHTLAFVSMIIVALGAGLLQGTMRSPDLPNGVDSIHHDRRVCKGGVIFPAAMACESRIPPGL